MKLKKEEKIASHQKLESRQIAKDVLKPLKEDTFKQLNDRGMMNTEKSMKFREELTPWLFEQVELILKAETKEGKVAEDSFNSVIKQ